MSKPLTDFQPLVERYRPRTIEGFIGLKKAKAVLKHLLNRPHPTSLLLIGPPGTGKTSIALAFAEELKAALIHIRSQKCTVDSVERVWEDLHYYPPAGATFWVVLCDEADQMSRQAQFALLSHLDSTANLALDFGGASRAAPPLPVIWIFTANGTGYRSTDPPPGFEPRFLSRCLPPVPFDAKTILPELRDFLERVWVAEGGNGQPDFSNGDQDMFKRWAAESRGSVRDALQAMEVRLMDCEFNTNSPFDQEPDVTEAASVKSIENKPNQTFAAAVSWQGQPLFDKLREDDKAFWSNR